MRYLFENTKCWEMNENMTHWWIIRTPILLAILVMCTQAHGHIHILRQADKQVSATIRLPALRQPTAKRTAASPPQPAHLPFLSLSSPFLTPTSTTRTSWEPDS
ncbi:glucagon receptor [Lates japonicus]|uniref:Glucagon receptor n=1 Tax=Lates japonicus TaxID=270547 RepID=A0AAD3R1N2_LATJO|nr:glucagon receptor [Lates japonicus]